MAFLSSLQMDAWLRCAVSLVCAGGAGWGQLYVVSTIAGGAPPPTPVLAVNASIGQPSSVAIGPDGNVYFSSDNAVFKVDSLGKMTLFAGTSRPGFSGDGGLAVNAQLNSPGGLAFGADGDLYIADSGNKRLRKVSGGVISTVAGGGSSSNADGLAATGAALASGPLAVALDAAGNLFFSEPNANRVRKVPSTGVLGTAAGTGAPGYSGDGGPATHAQMSQPSGVVFDKNANLYIADSANNAVRKVTPGGIISTAAGPTNAQGVSPAGLAVDQAGNLFIADQPHHRIVMLAHNGVATIVVGTGTPGFSGDGGAGLNAQLNSPSGLAVDAGGNLYIADAMNNRIRKVSADGTISTYAGNGSLNDSGDSGPAVLAQMSGPQGLAINGEGSVFVSDFNNHRVRKISPGGIITTVAGNGTPGFSGDSGPGPGAQLDGPAGLAVDGAGNLFIADSLNNRIRKVTPSGFISTVVGNGRVPASASDFGDGGAAIDAELNHPQGVAVDVSQHIYIADTGDNAIRKVSSGGVINTLVAAAAGVLNKPASIALDSVGNLFVAQDGPVVEITPQGATTRTVYGSTVSAAGVAVGPSGNLFYTGCGADVEELAHTGIHSTIAGNCGTGYSGDGGPGPAGRLNGPLGVAVDGAGNVYVADTNNNAVRLLTPVPQSALIGAVVDSASNAAGAVSPGKIVVLYGGGLGPDQIAEFQLQNGVIGTRTGGTSVYFNGIAAPILYSSATQVAAIVPYEVSAGMAQVTVNSRGQASLPLNVGVNASAPGIFTLNQTGAGQAAALNQNGKLNTAANPAKIGSYVTLFATGEGQTSPSGIDGKVALSPLPRPLLTVNVTIGGQTSNVSYAGAAPGEVAGVMQVNAQVPNGVEPGGYVPVVLRVGNAVSQAGVTIAVSK